MATEKEGAVALARESLRRWPELTIMLFLVLIFGWFIDRRDIRFEQIIESRDKAFASSQVQFLEEMKSNTMVLQRLADLVAPQRDGWSDHGDERPQRGG